MKIESYLPVFPGFYNTVFEPDEESLIEDGKTYDDYDWDYSEYYTHVGEKCCEFLQDELDFDIKINFQKISSPEFYNFGNDSINCEYNLKKTEYIRIIRYLEDNWGVFKKYIKEHYTSYDGFMSSYSDNGVDWINELWNSENDLSHIFGAILEFICQNKEIEYMDMYYYSTESAPIGCTLIED